MFDGPFSSSPSDMQPTTTTNESAEGKTSMRLEKDPSTDLDAYTPSMNGVGSRAVHPTNPSLSEIVSHEFPPFAAETLIIHPIMEEEAIDEIFYKGILRRI
jgi:hypothetical protein